MEGRGRGWMLMWWSEGEFRIVGNWRLKRLREPPSESCGTIYAMGSMHPRSLRYSCELISSDIAQAKLILTRARRDVSLHDVPTLLVQAS